MLAGLALLMIGLLPVARANPPAGYYEVWGDEFNSSTLDTTKWSYWLPGARRDAVNVTNAVSLNGTNLVITTYTSNSVHYTAMLANNTTFLSRNGYWETSAKWGDTNGMWSALWMQSPTMGTYLYDPAVSGSEIDIVEHRSTDGGSNGDIISQAENNIHWNGYGSSAASAGSGLIGSGLGSGFHTYGFLWTPSGYTIYIDGNNDRAWSYANNGVPISESCEWFIMSSEVDDTSTTWAGTIPSGGYGNLGTSTTQLAVDYVRYYAPTSTVFWAGTSSVYWTNSANWVSNMPVTAASDLTFSLLSGANLSPQLGQNYSVDGLVFLQMNNGCTVGGTNTLTLGAGGVDMVAANHSVTISCPVNIGQAQSWLVGPNSPGNTLTDSGGLAGSATLSKGSYGTLVLTGTNSFTGILNAGTGSTTGNDGYLQLASSGAAANAAAINIPNNNSGSSTLQLTGGITVPPPVTLSGRNTNVIGIQNLSGSNTLAGNFIVQSGGTVYWLDSDSGTLNFAGAVPASTPGGTRTLTFMGAGTVAITGTLQNGTGGGTVGIVKTNAGTLAINAPATFTGGTLLAQGVIQANATGALGTGTVTANPGANTAVIVLGNGVTLTNAITANSVNSGAGNNGLVMVYDNTSATCAGPVAFLANAASGGHICGPPTTGLLTMAGPITANATNNLIVRAGNVQFSGGGNYTALQVRANTSSLGANNGLATNAAVDIGGNGSTTVATLLDLNGWNQSLAGLTDLVTPANAAAVTNRSATAATLTLNLGATNYSFGGSIAGKLALVLNSGTQTLTKSGTTALNGIYNYTGNTTVNGGTLAVGSGIALPNTPVVTVGAGAVLDVSASGLTLGSAQTLTGGGTVLGNVTVNGTLALGGSIRMLTASNNVTLGATATNVFAISKAALTNSVLRVAGTLTYGGLLTVTNLAGTPAAGDAFTLFPAGAHAGSFAQTNLPALAAGLGWTFNAAAGSLTVVQTVATNAVSLVLTNAGTNWQLNWPADHTGWRLLAQTNPPGQGLGDGTNWYPFTGSAATNSWTIQPETANGSVFYRLIFP